MLVANDFFEQIAKNEGVDVEAEFYSTFDPSIAESKVRYLARDIVMATSKLSTARCKT